MPRPVKKLIEIERAAMRLFSERGLAQVTVRDIAREAGCAEGALYRHYPGKEAMAWELFRRETIQFGKELRSVLQSPTDYCRRVQAGVNAFYGLYDRDRVLFCFILLTQHDYPQAEAIEPDSNPSDLVVRFIREGVESGVFQASNIALAASMIMGLVLQPATFCIYGRLKSPLSQYVQPVSTACLRILQCDEGEGS